MKCADCGKGPLIPAMIWLEYAGFARPKRERTGQSGSSLIDRRPTGRGICGSCATKRQHGIPTEQTGLGI